MQPDGTRSVVISFRLEHLFGWGVTFILCLIPAIMWVQIHPLSQIRGFSGIMLSLGRVTGLVGLVMYALNLVYATRLRILETFFRWTESSLYRPPPTRWLSANFLVLPSRAIVAALHPNVI